MLNYTYHSHQWDGVGWCKLRWNIFAVVVTLSHNSKLLGRKHMYTPTHTRTHTQGGIWATSSISLSTIFSLHYCQIKNHWLFNIFSWSKETEVYSGEVWRPRWREKIVKYCFSCRRCWAIVCSLNTNPHYHHHHQHYHHHHQIQVIIVFRSISNSTPSSCQNNFEFTAAIILS